MPSVLLRRITAAIRDALALVLPIDCAGCGAPDRGLCDACGALLHPEVIRRQLPAGEVVFSGLDYSGVVARAILALKESHRTDVARHLAPALVAAVRSAVEAGTAVPVGPNAHTIALVPIPGTRAAFRRRGYEPVRVIAARAGFTVSNVFAPARPHRAQKMSVGSERAANVQGAFRLRRSFVGARFVGAQLVGRRVILVDDVVTTGATLAEAARVVREAGGEVVAAATIASTPRRSGPLSGRSGSTPRGPSAGDS